MSYAYFGGTRWVDLRSLAGFQADIEEFARPLSHLCRYCGALGWISVAQHSVITLKSLELAYKLLNLTVPDNQEELRRVKLYLLIHDIHEALTGDLTAPLKTALHSVLGNIKLETYMQYTQRRCLQAISLDYPDAEVQTITTWADRIAMLAEVYSFASDFDNARWWPWKAMAKPERLPLVGKRLSSPAAAEDFLWHYYDNRTLVD